MIECADLKSVINYQEVEALKHTIKVSRKRDEWREGRKGDPESMSSNTIKHAIRQ